MELERVWSAYRDLAVTRPTGMGPSPVTYQEIEAYQRQTFAGLTAWQVALIRRVDDVILAVISRDTAKPAPGEPQEISGKDAQGVKALLRGMAAKAAPKP